MARASGSRGFIVVNTVMFALTVGIASAAMWPIYESDRLILLVAVSLTVGSAIVLAAAAYRWSATVVLIVSVLAYLLLGVPLAVPDRAAFDVLPTLEGIRDLLAATATGWKQLVTITLPVGGFEALLVPAFVLVFFGTVIGLSIALRARHGEVAAVVPVIIFIAAIALGAESTDLPLPLALALLIVILFWMIWVRWYRRRASIRRLVGSTNPVEGGGERTDTRLGYRTIIGATVTMALAATTGIAAVSLFPPDSSREVLRTSVEKPFDPRDYSSPLSGFRAYHQDSRANQPMFTVEGLPADGRIRVATLDTYDGIVYSVGSDDVTSASGSFVRVPTAFDQSAVPGDRVELEVTIDRYEGIWLPTVGKLERVAFAGSGSAELKASLFYNDNSGTAAVIANLSSGDSYRMSAVIPQQPSRSLLASLEPGTAEVPRPGLLPEELALSLSSYVADAPTPGAKLQAMLQGLRTEGYVSHGVADDEPKSRSGHAADRITQLVTDQRMIGDAEQYAVTAALMASELGFPARVVFGFVPENVNRDGATTVRGGDASAWIEVNTTRFGWVTLDPNPEPRAIPDEEPEEPTQVARPQSPVQPPPVEPDLNTEQLQLDSSQEEVPLPNPILALLIGIAQVLGITLAGALILLSPFILIAAAKLRRRMLRKRARSAIARVSGGWQEFEDSVLDHGYVPPPSPTRTEVARTVGGTRPLVLASVADRAVFSPDVTDDEQADRVWRAVEELREALGQGRTRWQRVKALVSMRSLGGYSVKSLLRR